jgi:preprotein translocase subunit SecY
MSFQLRYKGAKMFLGGFLILGLAVTQSLYGWIGSGDRVVYPLLLVVAAAFFFCVGWAACSVDVTDNTAKRLQEPNGGKVDAMTRVK